MAIYKHRQLEINDPTLSWLCTLVGMLFKRPRVCFSGSTDLKASEGSWPGAAQLRTGSQQGLGPNLAPRPHPGLQRGPAGLLEPGAHVGACSSAGPRAWVSPAPPQGTPGSDEPCTSIGDPGLRVTMLLHRGPLPLHRGPRTLGEAMPIHGGPQAQMSPATP